MRHLVLIEFTTATAKRAVGARMRVDRASAVSLVDVQKVAVRVGATPTPPPPPPPPVPVPDPVPTPVDDDAA